MHEWQRAAGDAEQKLQAFEVQQLAIVRERDQVREERDRQARELQLAQERLAELDELRLVRFWPRHACWEIVLTCC